MQPNTPDLLNMRMWLLLAVVGAVLAVIGWYQFFR